MKLLIHHEMFRRCRFAGAFVADNLHRTWRRMRNLWSIFMVPQRVAEPVQHSRNVTMPSDRFRHLPAVLLMFTLGWAALAVPGCSPLGFNLSDFSFNSEDKPVTPTRMIPVWTDTVLTRAGKPGVRGFGGRIVFYQEGRTLPVRVDGSIVVYAWDDTESKALSKVPDRKYVITAEELPEHFSESRIGPSYSIWIPWDEAGGAHRKITLVTRFVGTNGAEVVSEAIDAVLPGPTDDQLIVEERTLPSPDSAPVDVALHENIADLTTGEMIQQASWQTGPSPSDRGTAQRRMRTTTLNVSPSFAARHFRDNSIPLNPADQWVGHHRIPSTETAAISGVLADDPLAPHRSHDALRQTADSALPRPPVHSAPTARPAQSAQPAQPGHSPLRSQPRRAEWQPRPRPTPQSLPAHATPQPARPLPEAGAPLSPQEAGAAQNQY